MKFYVIKNLGKKSGKEYVALQLDFGYRQLLLSFDPAVISEVSGLSFQEMYAMKCGDKICVGNYVSSKVGK